MFDLTKPERDLIEDVRQYIVGPSNAINDSCTERAMEVLHEVFNDVHLVNQYVEGRDPYVIGVAAVDAVRQQALHREVSISVAFAAAEEALKTLTDLFGDAGALNALAETPQKTKVAIAKKYTDNAPKRQTKIEVARDLIKDKLDRPSAELVKILEQELDINVAHARSYIFTIKKELQNA